MGGYCRYRGRIGGGAAYALFLHRAYESGLRIARGRLGKLLLGQHLLKIHPLAFLKARQLASELLCLLVPALLINGGIAGEFHLGVVGAEDIIV